jgi:hypothetical protein
VSIEILAPDGAIGAPAVALAASPRALAGLRIGVLDNGKPNARLLMTRVAEGLAARTGAIVALVTDKGPGGSAATPCTGETLERIGKEVDLVLTGSAD